MSTITLHDVDTQVEGRIRELARKQQKSINKTTQGLLRSALGLGEKAADRRADFADLLGVWSPQDLAEFVRATGGVGDVDAEDWK